MFVESLMILAVTIADPELAPGTIAARNLERYSAALVISEWRRRRDSFPNPAIMRQHVKIIDKGDYLVVEPAEGVRPHAIIRHIHGIGGITNNEMILAEKLAAGQYTLPVKVVMPLADRIVQDSWTTHLPAIVQLARYAVHLSPDMMPKVFDTKGDMSWMAQMRVAHKAVTNPASWYSFKFKLDETSPVPSGTAESFTYIGMLSAPIRRNLFPKLVPDIEATIPNMLEIAAKVGARTDQILLAEGANGHIKIIDTAFSQGTGIAAPKVLQKRHDDPRLTPSCLIAVGAPIILDCGMPPIGNRHIPTFNILPRDDQVMRILNYGPERVREQAALQGFPIRVMEPGGEHGFCEQSARLAIAIIKRELEGPLERRKSQPARTPTPAEPENRSFVAFFTGTVRKGLTSAGISL